MEAVLRGTSARKRGRLSSSGDFDRVYRKGKSRASRYLVAYEFARDDRSSDQLRLGISVNKRVGGAVKRNRIKRLLREAFWSLGSGLNSSCDYVLVARTGVVDLAEQQGLEGVKKALQEVIVSESQAKDEG